MVEKESFGKNMGMQKIVLDDCVLNAVEALCKMTKTMNFLLLKSEKITKKLLTKIITMI